MREIQPLLTVLPSQSLCLTLHVPFSNAQKFSKSSSFPHILPSKSSQTLVSGVIQRNTDKHHQHITECLGQHQTGKHESIRLWLTTLWAPLLKREQSRVDEKQTQINVTKQPKNHNDKKIQMKETLITKELLHCSNISQDVMNYIHPMFRYKVPAQNSSELLVHSIYSILFCFALERNRVLTPCST